jgi:hypothetical protein
MKKNILFVAILVVIGLLVSPFQVFAAPQTAKPTPKTHENTPGPKKTKEAKPNKGKAQNYKGAVAGKSATSLTLTLKDGSSVTFIVNADTSIKIPGSKDVTVDQINVGVQAMVRAKADESGGLVALKIQVVPGKPVRIHRVGVVTEYIAGTSITITSKDGSITTFLLTADTKILPKKSASKLAVGLTVTIISRRDTAGGPLTAQGIVIHNNGTDKTDTTDDQS